MEFIPEPWLIHVQVCIEGRAPLERWCYILGVGDANRRGLAIYDIHDHEAAVSNRSPPVISTTLMFIGKEKRILILFAQMVITSIIPYR